MADLAREEADRYLNSRGDRLTSHPEDQDHSDHDDNSDSDDDTTTEPAFQSSANKRVTANEDTDDEDDLSYTMSTLTTSRTAHQVPRGVSYANTGPKGVIADAQHFALAKKSTFRKTLASITNNFSPKPSVQARREKQSRIGSTLSDRENSSDEDSPRRGQHPKNGTRVAAGTAEEDQEDDDVLDDEEFMNQWRESRLKELQSQTQNPHEKQQSQQRRISPSRRVYGSVPHVSPNGYLDAIEHSPPVTTVLVLLFDPSRQNTQSRQAESICDYLAQKYLNVKFVKLDFGVADMEHLACPSVIAYRAGDVVGTVSSAAGGVTGGNMATMSEDGETGLEKELIAQGVLDQL